jgi:hypothetical protein
MGGTLARILALAAFGAVVISIFDGFHTYSETTQYTTIVAWRAAWWTPLIFGLSTGVGGPVYVLSYRTLGGRRLAPGWTPLAIAFVIYGALYAFSGFYKGTNEAKLAVLGAAAVALFAWLDRTAAGAGTTLLTALVGPLVEVVLVHLDAFKHLQPDVAGIPMWLPALYACSAVVLGQGARRLLDPSATTTSAASTGTSSPSAP